MDLFPRKLLKTLFVAFEYSFLFVLYLLLNVSVTGFNGQGRLQDKSNDGRYSIGHVQCAYGCAGGRSSCYFWQSLRHAYNSITLKMLIKLWQRTQVYLAYSASGSRSQVDHRWIENISFSFWRQLAVSDASTEIPPRLQWGSSAHRWRFSRWCWLCDLCAAQLGLWDGMGWG